MFDQNKLKGRIGMQKVELRVECLKLAHRVDRSPAEIIHIARELEKYALEPQVENTSNGAEEPLKKKPGRPKKIEGGNSDILS